MPLFSYKVKDSRGREFEGAVEADNATLASEVLKERGYQVVSVTEREAPSFGEIRFTFVP